MRLLTGLPTVSRPARTVLRKIAAGLPHPCRKRTWLLFSKIPRASLPPIPPWQEPTHVIGGQRETREKRKAGLLPPRPQYSGGSWSAAHLTPPDFADWLLLAASRARV